MGELIDASMKKVKDEKDIEELVLDIAHIKAPNDGDKSKMHYNISVEPKDGGTTFRFSYDLTGKLLDFDY
jgi:hypothetical protein